MSIAGRYGVPPPSLARPGARQEEEAEEEAKEEGRKSNPSRRLDERENANKRGGRIEGGGEDRRTEGGDSDVKLTG